mgnify:CR=1 FL=1
MKDMAGSGAPVIEARGLDLVFQTGDGPVQALKDVNLLINKGDFVSFIGPSGCGKTTFLRAVAALEHPTGGTLTVNADGMVDNTTLDINGSATYTVTNLEANTDAAGPTGTVSLAYTDVTDNAASITTRPPGRMLWRCGCRPARWYRPLHWPRGRSWAHSSM